MKKWLSLVLALTLAVSLFAGCNNQPAKPTGDEPAGTTDPVSQTAAPTTTVHEDITITIGLPVNIKIEDYETNAFTKWLEEETGYSIDFVLFDSDKNNYTSQLATRLDDMPDILWNFGLDADVYSDYGKDDYFIDLTPYYEDKELSANFWTQMEKLPEDLQSLVWNSMKDVDTGEIYVHPTVDWSNGAALCDYIVWINTDWLEALNLEMPTDPESLYNVLKAFKEGDPNGNGKDDEIPCVGIQGGYCGDIVNWLVNMYEYTDDRRWWNMGDDGQLYSPFTTDSYREALKFINKLVTEGLMPDVAWSGKNPELKAILNNDTGVGTVGIWAGHPTTFIDNDSPILLEYEALPYWGYAVQKDISNSYKTFITECCEHPEAAFKVLMAMTSEEGSIRMRYGEEGVDWEDANGFVKEDGTVAKIKVLNTSAFNSQTNQTWGVVCGTMLCYPLIPSYTESADTEQSEFAAHKAKLTTDAWDLFAEAMEKNNPEFIMPKLVYTSEQAAAIEIEEDNCQAFIKEKRSHFCTGVADPYDDAQWEAYLNELKAMGIEKWRDQAQTVFENQ